MTPSNDILTTPQVPVGLRNSFPILSLFPSSIKNIHYKRFWFLLAHYPEHPVLQQLSDQSQWHSHPSGMAFLASHSQQNGRCFSGHIVTATAPGIALSHIYFKLLTTHRDKGKRNLGHSFITFSLFLGVYLQKISVCLPNPYKSVQLAISASPTSASTACNDSLRIPSSKGSPCS